MVITVPPTLADVIEQLVEAQARRLGEPPEACRRAVETAILARGCAAVQREMPVALNVAATVRLDETLRLSTDRPKRLKGEAHAR